MADEPLRTTTFLLTTADALAYEQAAGRVTPLGILALLLWLGLWGSAALLLPPDWAGPRVGWTFSLLVSVLVAIAYVLALLLLSVRQWLRARRRMKRPTELTLSEWPDRLDVIGGGLMPREIAFPEIRRSLSTKAYIFLETDEDVLILPRRAFPEVGAFENLAARIVGTPRPILPSDAGPTGAA